MSLTIKNNQFLIAADPVVVGAAVKILNAGGSSLNAAEQFQASGVSKFVWTERATKITNLLAQMI